MLDIVQRYQPIVRFINKNPPPERKVLEVGGGGDGLGYYLKKYEIVDCDLQHAASCPKNTRCVAIKNEKLPFANSYIHTTVCVDTLEHLPDDRKKLKLLQEIVRVTQKYLYLAVPTGQKSLLAHKRLKKHLVRFYPKRKNHYLEEHLKFGHPQKEKITELVRKAAPQAKILTQVNANIYLWLFFQKLYLALPQLYHLLKYRNFWRKTLTPFWWLFSQGSCLRTIYFINLRPTDEEY